MKSSDIITAFILDMLSKSDGYLELQRNELAQKFNVVPSQINYVISSRFTPEHGYIIESQRGGGGFIRIKRVHFNKCTYIMHAVNAIGKTLNAFDARIFIENLSENGYILPDMARLIQIAVSDISLSPLSQPVRDELRANITKNLLIALIS